MLKVGTRVTTNRVLPTLGKRFYLFLAQFLQKLERKEQVCMMQMPGLLFSPILFSVLFLKTEYWYMQLLLLIITFLFNDSSNPVKLTQWVDNKWFRMKK